MKSFARREDVLLGCNSPNRQFQNSAKSTNRDSDLDFSDVFGGPPRRFSMPEIKGRYSFGESMESEQDEGLERNPWSGFDERPVFGAENFNRRSYKNDDFFDDIFRGDDSKPYDSPKISRDVFASSPVSRISSPAWPLPPKAEPFSTSVSCQLSLPAKMTNETDFPLFGSPSRSRHKSKDGIANVSLSRFSGQPTELIEETKKDESSYRPSPLSHQVSVNSEDLEYETKSDEKNKGEKLSNNSENMDASSDSFHFHFSIYKWAGKGMPLLMPLIGSKKLRCKSKNKMERCSSSKGRIHCDSNYNGDSQEVEDHIIGEKTEAVSSRVEDEKQDETNKESNSKSENMVGETNREKSELEDLKTAGCPILNKAEEGSHIKDEVKLYKKTEEQRDTKEEQVQKPALRPLSAFFNEERQEQGNATDGDGNKHKFSTLATEDDEVINSLKRTSGRKFNARSQGSPTKPGDAISKSAAKGKVKEFVKIFDQETSVKPKKHSEIPSQRSRWKGADTNETQKEVSSSIKSEAKVHVPNTKKTKDAAFREDDNLKGDKQDAHPIGSAHKTNRRFTNEKNAPSFSDSISSNQEAKAGKREISSHGHFPGEELSNVLDKDLHTRGDSEDIKSLDAKIQQWSNGRKGNIRSLLSTLQLVLWPESGWKPVPLVDIIEGSAVKRAYQKALLCLHPDKLQQKGAASHQKHMAEKVFDILQEAWDHFNSSSAI